MYEKINGDDFKNVYVVGDIHGKYDLLLKSLKENNFNFEGDLLICVGDLIDRGQQNIECLELLNKKWFRTTKGNHEQLAFWAVEYHHIYDWSRNGGSWYFSFENKDYLKELIKKAYNQPLILEISRKNKKIIVCHADYPFNEYEFNKEVFEDDIIWNRERLEFEDKTKIIGADVFIHGHTPLKNFRKLGNRYYIDTAGYGEFTILNLDHL